MRSSSVTCAAVAATLCAAVGVEAAIPPFSLAAAHRRPATGRRSQPTGSPDDLPSLAECVTRKAMRTYGSSERCLQALCAGRNVVNTFVTDGAHRLRRNPCAGVDPFERQ